MYLCWYFIRPNSTLNLISKLSFSTSIELPSWMVCVILNISQFWKLSVFNFFPLLVLHRASIRLHCQFFRGFFISALKLNHNSSVSAVIKVYCFMARFRAYLAIKHDKILVSLDQLPPLRNYFVNFNIWTFTTLACLNFPCEVQNESPMRNTRYKCFVFCSEKWSVLLC